MNIKLTPAAWLPAVTLLGCLSILYLLDAAVIHIPFYADLELVVFSAAFTLILSVYAIRTDVYHFGAAAANVFTSFLILRAIFCFQHFMNACDPLDDLCSLSRYFRFPTTMAIFLTLVPCAGLYGASAYFFMSAKGDGGVSMMNTDAVARPEPPIVVVGHPTVSNKEVV